MKQLFLLLLITSSSLGNLLETLHSRLEENDHLAASPSLNIKLGQPVKPISQPISLHASQRPQPYPVYGNPVLVPENTNQRVIQQTYGNPVLVPENTNQRVIQQTYGNPVLVPENTNQRVIQQTYGNPVLVPENTNQRVIQQTYGNPVLVPENTNQRVIQQTYGTPVIDVNHSFQNRNPVLVPQNTYQRVQGSYGTPVIEENRSIQNFKVPVGQQKISYLDSFISKLETAEQYLIEKLSKFDLNDPPLVDEDNSPKNFGMQPPSKLFDEGQMNNLYAVRNLAVQELANQNESPDYSLKLKAFEAAEERLKNLISLKLVENQINLRASNSRGVDFSSYPDHGQVDSNGFVINGAGSHDQKLPLKDRIKNRINLRKELHELRKKRRELIKALRRRLDERRPHLLHIEKN